MKLLFLLAILTGIDLSVATKTHIITVGHYMSFFTPPSLFGVSPGDFVEFQYPGSAHTVVRGDYNAPCRPGVDSNTLGRFGNGSVWSDVVGGLTDYNTWTILINDTQPFWYYDCSHCANSMVGVINPPAPSTGQTLQGWRDGHQNVTDYDAIRIPQRESCPEGQHGGVLKKKDGLSLFDPPNASATASAKESKPTGGGGGGSVGGQGGEAGPGTGDQENNANKVGVSHRVASLVGFMGAIAWYRGL